MSCIPTYLIFLCVFFKKSNAHYCTVRITLHDVNINRLIHKWCLVSYQIQNKHCINKSSFDIYIYKCGYMGKAISGKPTTIMELLKNFMNTINPV